jgi:hypothetical protein
MKINLVSILVILFFTTSYVQAQEVKESRQEVTLLLNSFDNIGVGYRIGTSSALWRVSLTAGASKTEHILNDSTSRNTYNESSISIDLGREYRFKVAEDLFLRLGGDIFYRNRIRKNETGEESRFQMINKDVENELGFKIVSGVMYQPTERIHVGFELLPSLSWKRAEKSTAAPYNQQAPNFHTNTEESYALNLNNSSLRFNIGFNF